MLFVTEMVVCWITTLVLAVLSFALVSDSIRKAKWFAWMSLFSSAVGAFLAIYEFIPLDSILTGGNRGDCLVIVCVHGLPAVFSLRALFASASKTNKTIPVCPKCSYMLLGLRESICPECGLHFDPSLLIRPMARKAVRK
jgi:hypothetical protein